MIFTILKVIGIIILVILLILILILSLLLFVPIRYRFSGEYFEKPDVLATVRYIPAGLNAKVSFNEDGLSYTIKLLGGVIMTNTGTELSWLGKKFFPEAGRVDEPHDDKAEHAASYGEQGDVKNKRDEAGESESHKKPAEKKGSVKEDDSKRESIQSKAKKQDKKTGRGSASHKRKRNSVARMISEKKKQITDKYNEIVNKLSQLNNKKDNLLKVYRSKRFEIAKSDVFKYIKELIWAVKPTHVEGRVHFGMDDPATTGEILGGLSVILPIYEPFLVIIPDFEKQCLEAVLKGYGKIRLWSIARIAIKIIFNKNLIKVTKKVQTIIEA